jgi:hypothetical protein
MHLHVDEIDCPTAYNVGTAGDQLYLFTESLAGTETRVDATKVRVVKAERTYYTATSNPTINDDANDGFTAGSWWLNTTTEDMWYCVDPTAGSALWKRVIVSSSGVGNQQQILYVGLHGNDAADGKGIDDAKRTIQNAITAAGSPANEAAAYTIIVMDDGEYDEDLTHSSYVNIFAPSATIKGTNTMAANMSITARRLINDGDTRVIDMTAVGHAFVTAEQISSTSTTVEAILVNNSGSILHLTSTTIEVGSYRAIEAQDGTAWLDVGTINAATCVYTTGTAFVRGRVNYLTGTNGIVTGAGTGASIDLIVSVISASGAAYNITASNFLRLLVTKVSGTETIADTARVQVTLAKRNNYIATSDPTVSDDANDGYDAGSIWLNTSTTEWYICSDASTGAAVWRELTVGSGGTTVDTTDPTVNDDQTQGYDVGDFWLNTTTESLWQALDVSTSAAVWWPVVNPQTQVLYVSKSGDDTYDGRSPERPKLTISSAITAAGNPLSEDAAVSINILDDGEYDEDLTCVSYVNIYAPQASLKGTQTLADNMSIVARRLVDDTAAIFSKAAGAGAATVKADIISSTSTTSAAGSCSSGKIRLEARYLSHTGAAGLSVAGGTVELNVDEWNCDDQQAIAASTGTGLVIGRVGNLYGIAGSTGIFIQTGAKVDLVAGRISTATAYNVDATPSYLRLLVSEILGTETAASGSDVNVSFAGGRDQTQVIYVSKTGNNSFDGLTPDKAKLTIAAAITAAGTPASEAAAVRIEVLDSGEYDEDLTHVSYVNICAPSATLKGTQTMATSMCIQARRLINDGATGVITKATTGVSIVKAELLWSNGAARLISHTAGTLYVECDRIEQTADDVIYSANSGSIIRIQADDIIVPATKYGIDVAGADVDGHIGAITGGIAIRVTTGSAHLSVTEINSTTAYNISAGATLRLFAAALSGTETAADTADVRVTKAKRNNWTATTNPTVNDDTNDGYDVGSMWLNTTNRNLWQCISATAAAAVWNLVSRNDIHVAMNGENSSFFTVKSATYTIAARVTFLGTNLLGTPSSAKFIARTDTGGGSVDCRIYDVTNGQVIAEYTAITSTTFAIYTDSTLTNLPTGEAVFEIQVRDTGGQNAEISSAAIIWG